MEEQDETDEDLMCEKVCLLAYKTSTWRSGIQILTRGKATEYTNGSWCLPAHPVLCNINRREEKRYLRKRHTCQTRK